MGLELAGVRTPPLLNARFRDFDELSAATAAWDLDFLQLDGGRGPTTLTQVAVPGLLLQRFRFSRAYLQRGESPPSMRTFGLLEPDGPAVRMFGGDLTGSEVALFGADREFEAVSPPGIACLALSIDEALLDEALDAVELPRNSGTPDAGPRVVKIEPEALERLRRRARQLLEAMEADPRVPGHSEVIEELALELPLDLALAIQSADDIPKRTSSRVRDRALRRAVAIIENHLDEPIRIRELCEEIGVGWTLLVQAFREQFGVTPKAYLTAARLSRVRKGLMEAPSGTAIADVANRWGLWHMGQFAADYKRLFGELPSDTRSRRVVG